MGFTGEPVSGIEAVEMSLIRPVMPVDELEPR